MLTTNIRVTQGHYSLVPGRPLQIGWQRCDPWLNDKLVGFSVNHQYTVNAPEDGRNYRPKHVELIVIINKPSFLYLVVCLYYCLGFLNRLLNKQTNLYLQL